MLATPEQSTSRSSGGLKAHFRPTDEKPFPLCARGVPGRLSADFTRVTPV
jgi:hypothetical protein